MIDLSRIDEIEIATGKTIREGDEEYKRELGMLLEEIDLDALLED